MLTNQCCVAHNQCCGLHTLALTPRQSGTYIALQCAVWEEAVQLHSCSARLKEALLPIAERP